MNFHDNFVNFVSNLKKNMLINKLLKCLDVSDFEIV